MPPEVSAAFERVSGKLPHEGFGQTETTLIIGTLRGMTPRPGSMGRANPQFDVVLLDHEGNPVRTGETGEICVRADRGNPPPGLFRRSMTSEVIPSVESLERAASRRPGVSRANWRMRR